MDIYDFTQVLIRQKRLLLVGFAALVAFVLMMAVDFSDGIGLRSSPKYQATVPMAVVPEGFESLTQDLGSASLAGPAIMFSSLLSSPEAALEIQELAGVPILGLEVSTTGRDRFFTAKVLSDSPDGAVAAAATTFEWLEQRLSEPLLTASAPADPTPTPALLDQDGRLRGLVRLEFDHALAIDAEGLWAVTSTVPGDGFAYRLLDAAVEPIAEYETLIEPGGTMALRLESAVGNSLDEIAVELPELPAGEARSYRLVVQLDRGSVRGVVGAPRLDDDRIGVSWEAIGGPSAEESVDEVSVLLLTDVPVPASIGGRRTPLLIVAFLAAGTIALLVLAVAVDSWKQERARRQTGIVPSDATDAVGAQLGPRHAPDGKGSASSEGRVSGGGDVADEVLTADNMVEAIPLNGEDASDGEVTEGSEDVALGEGDVPIDERFETLRRRLSS